MTPTSWSSTSSWGKRLDRGHPSGLRRPTGLRPSYCFCSHGTGAGPVVVGLSHRPTFFASHPCMRSGHRYARSRARVLFKFLSIHEKRRKKSRTVGQRPNLRGFQTSHLVLEKWDVWDAAKTTEAKASRVEIFTDIRQPFTGRHPRIHRMALNRSCCHQNRAVKRVHLRWVRPQSAAGHPPPDPAITPGLFV